MDDGRGVGEGFAGSGKGSGIGDEDGGGQVKFEALESESEMSEYSEEEMAREDFEESERKRAEQLVPPGFHEFLELQPLGRFDDKCLDQTLREHQEAAQHEMRRPAVFDDADLVGKLRMAVLGRQATGKALPEMPPTFVAGGFDSRVSREWLYKHEPIIADCNATIDRLTQLTENLQAEMPELCEPSPKLMQEKEDREEQIEELNRAITQLSNQIAANETGATNSLKKVREEMAARENPDLKVEMAKLALKVKELRLKTVKANYRDDFVGVPLRLRRQLKADERLELAADMHEARAHNYTWERIRHFLFLGDRKRKIASHEEVWVKHQELKRRVADRRAMRRWNPFEIVEQKVEQQVGGNIAQVFVFYQFIMVNNFIMSNLWTVFVIIPYFVDPPPELNLSQVTWAGLAGLDDKALEYSWFYYGAYQRVVNMFGFEYRMDYAYIAVMVAMFVFQLGVMLSGVFKSLREKPMDFIAETDDPSLGIKFSTLVFGSTNHVIQDLEVQVASAGQTTAALQELLSIEAQAVGEKEKQKEREREEREKEKRETEEMSLLSDEEKLAKRREKFTAANPMVEEAKMIIGRVVGILLYLGLFQISTNGIAACYQNESTIRESFPYGVPLFVTSIRVLVPFVMVPLLLKIERRQEPNLFYHTIVRMFLLKMYTMNVILSVLRNLDPVPGGICRAIFIGKVYWRQELVDLLFSLILDLMLALKRRKQATWPQFDHEELAERVMELLYRQSFIWVSAPYSPMLAYLGLFSTSILYFFQWKVLPMSFNPPVHGWGRKGSDTEFRLLLLATAVATFYPSWTFMHSKMDCGPYQSANSPYDYIKEQLRSGPDWLWNLTYYGTVPSTMMALIMGTLFTQVYLQARNKSLRHKVNLGIQSLDANSHDKIQLLRANGIQY